jgi:hypothetical protein
MPTFVINTECGAGFCLSAEAHKELGWNITRFSELDDKRSDPMLVYVCRKLGRRAGMFWTAFTFVDVDTADAPFVKISSVNGIESITIDTDAKQKAAISEANAAQEKIISATRAVLLCTHLSDSEKISLITTIHK